MPMSAGLATCPLFAGSDLSNEGASDLAAAARAGRREPGWHGVSTRARIVIGPPTSVLMDVIWPRVGGRLASAPQQLAPTLFPCASTPRRGDPGRSFLAQQNSWASPSSALLRSFQDAGRRAPGLADHHQGRKGRPRHEPNRRDTMTTIGTFTPAKDGF